jgi:hypothetical protein
MLGAMLRNSIEHFDQLIYPRVGFELQNITYALDDGPGTTRPPIPSSAGRTGRLTVAFDLVRPRIGSLSIEIRSAKASPSEGEGEVLLFTLPLKDARAQEKRPSITLTPEERDIPVGVYYTEEDLKDAKGDLRGGDESQARTAVQNALARVAWLAFVSAQHARISLHAPAPFVEEVNAAKEAVENAFRIDLVGDQISVDVEMEDMASPDDPDAADTAHPWVVRVKRVPPLGPVVLDVPPYPWEEALRKFDPVGAERIKRDRERRAALILDKTRPARERLSLEMTPGEHGWYELEEFRRTLIQEYDLEGLRYELTSTEAGLQLNGSVLLPVVIKTLSGTGGFSYNVEEGLTGDASVRADNLFGAGETFSTAFKGGKQFQKAIVDGRLHRHTSHTMMEWRLDGLYLRNRDQRLGNPVGSAVEDEESGAETGLAVRYDTLCWEKAPAERPSRQLAGTLPANRGISALDVALEYRDVDLEARGVTLSGAEDGRISTATFTLSQTLQHRPHLERHFGVGFLEAGISGAAQKGLRLLAGDFDYTRYDVAAQVTLFLGRPDQPRNLFVRWRQGFATGTTGTPLIRLPRIGGPETVRGIEDGEITASDVLYRQIELGVRLLAVADWLRRRQSAGSESAQQESSQSAATLLDHAYMKGFYDVGRATESLRSGNVLWVSPGVEGYGVGIEVRELPVPIRRQRAAVSLGYAFSPDSELHRSGVFFTKILLEF